MADYATTSRVAKILARATSPEEGEAKSALEHAYKRMVRDGVTLQDLLTLPETELFQDALVRLVDVILSYQANMSPPAKRAAYAEYMRLIVAKFSGAGQGSGNDATGERQRSRDEEAKEYRERHGYQQEKSRADFTRGNDKTNKPQNESPTSQENSHSFIWAKIPEPLARAFGFVRPWFQHGGICWLFFHEPAIMLRLLAASILWGMAFALTLVTVAAVVHIVTNTSPVVDVSLKVLFSALTAAGTIWRYRLFLRAPG